MVWFCCWLWGIGISHNLSPVVLRVPVRIFVPPCIVTDASFTAISSFAVKIMVHLSSQSCPKEIRLWLRCGKISTRFAFVDKLFPSGRSASKVEVIWLESGSVTVDPADGRVFSRVSAERRLQ